MGGLSTHILDLTCGKPAPGVAVTLLCHDAVVGTGVTDDDGRCKDLLGDTPLATGPYRLVFAIGAYFKRRTPTTEVFFDEVPIDFHVSDASAHHHVPLLATPHGYSTYRGS